MAIKIEVFAVRADFAKKYGGAKCHYRFGAEFKVDGDPDAACLAAGAVARALGPMYAGDKMKVVAYCHDKRVAQFIDVIPRAGGFPEELACMLESCRPRAEDWAWVAPRVKPRAWADKWAAAAEPGE